MIQNGDWRLQYVMFLSLAAILCEGENCTTIIIELFVIFGQFGSYLCNVLYVAEQSIKFLGFNHVMFSVA
jgi:hypothetical protein